MILLAVPPLLLLIWFVLQYNGLITLRNHITESWGNIDTELKRRYDLIPNLVATVQGYAAHERETLARISELRNLCASRPAAAGAQAADERELVTTLQRLLVAVEDYPQLKADRHFLALQQELTVTENRIQAARRFYNGNIRDYANKCETFPSNLVARAFGFRPPDYFNVPPAVREVPNAQF